MSNYRRFPSHERGRSEKYNGPTFYNDTQKAYRSQALPMGIDEGMKDKYHRPREPVITEEAKAWVINLACKKATDYGYAPETWTCSALADHPRKYGPEAGHDCLKKAAKATVQRILDEHMSGVNAERDMFIKSTEYFRGCDKGGENIWISTLVTSRGC